MARLRQSVSIETYVCTFKKALDVEHTHTQDPPCEMSHAAAVMG